MSGIFYAAQDTFLGLTSCKHHTKEGHLTRLQYTLDAFSDPIELDSAAVPALPVRVLRANALVWPPPVLPHLPR